MTDIILFVTEHKDYPITQTTTFREVPMRFNESHYLARTSDLLNLSYFELINGTLEDLLKIDNLEILFHSRIIYKIPFSFLLSCCKIYNNDNNDDDNDDIYNIYGYIR